MLCRCNQVSNQYTGGANAKLCEEKGGNKVKTEDIWKELLTIMKYEEWGGLELKERPEQVKEEYESPVNQSELK